MAGSVGRDRALEATAESAQLVAQPNPEYAPPRSQMQARPAASAPVRRLERGLSLPLRGADRHASPEQSRAPLVVASNALPGHQERGRSSPPRGYRPASPARRAPEPHDSRRRWDEYQREIQHRDRRYRSSERSPEKRSPRERSPPQRTPRPSPPRRGRGAHAGRWDSRRREQSLPRPQSAGSGGRRGRRNGYARGGGSRGQGSTADRAGNLVADAVREVEASGAAAHIHVSVTTEPPTAPVAVEAAPLRAPNLREYLPAAAARGPFRGRRQAPGYPAPQNTVGQTPGQVAMFLPRGVPTAPLPSRAGRDPTLSMCRMWNLAGAAEGLASLQLAACEAMGHTPSSFSQGPQGQCVAWAGEIVPLLSPVSDAPAGVAPLARTFPRLALDLHAAAQQGTPVDTLRFSAELLHSMAGCLLAMLEAEGAGLFLKSTRADFAGLQRHVVDVSLQMEQLREENQRLREALQQQQVQGAEGGTLEVLEVWEGMGEEEEAQGREEVQRELWEENKQLQASHASEACADSEAPQEAPLGGSSDLNPSEASEASEAFQPSEASATSAASEALNVGQRTLVEERVEERERAVRAAQSTLDALSCELAAAQSQLSAAQQQAQLEREGRQRLAGELASMQALLLQQMQMVAEQKELIARLLEREQHQADVLEPGGSGTVGHGAVGQGAVGQGAVGQGAVGQGAVGQGAVGQGAVGQGAVGQGAVGQGAVGQGAVGQGAVGQGQWAKGQWAKGQWAKGQWAKGQWAKGQWAKGQWAKGQWAKGQWPGWAKGQWAKGQWAKGQWAKGQWAKGQWAKGQWAKGSGPRGSGAKGQWAKGQWAKGQWAKGQWAKGQWAKGQWAKGQWAKGQWAKGQWAKGQWAKGQWAKGQWAKGQWAKGQWAKGQWAQEQSTGDGDGRKDKKEKRERKERKERERQERKERKEREKREKREKGEKGEDREEREEREGREGREERDERDEREQEQVECLDRKDARRAEVGGVQRSADGRKRGDWCDETGGADYGEGERCRGGAEEAAAAVERKREEHRGPQNFEALGVLEGRAGDKH
ncbi:unnamed protein product [Closterium sp. NIES-64]|nr:unnamed protein product [Closterium sp. NIES-64]